MIYFYSMKKLKCENWGILTNFQGFNSIYKNKHIIYLIQCAKLYQVELECILANPFSSTGMGLAKRIPTKGPH